MPFGRRGGGGGTDGGKGGLGKGNGVTGKWLDPDVAESGGFSC